MTKFYLTLNPSEMESENPRELILWLCVVKNAYLWEIWLDQRVCSNGDGPMRETKEVLDVTNVLTFLCSCCPTSKRAGSLRKGQWPIWQCRGDDFFMTLLRRTTWEGGLVTVLLLWQSTMTKAAHKIKHLIGACVRFQRSQPWLSCWEAQRHTGRHAAKARSWEPTSDQQAEKAWLDLTWDFELRVHALVTYLLQQGYLCLLIPPKQYNWEQNIQIY